MRMTRCRWFIGLLAMLVAGGLLSACATTGKTAAEAGIAPNITYQVADSAQLTKIAYYFKAYKGGRAVCTWS